MAELRASDGTRLYAEAHGSGLPVLLSCGMCTTHENWRAQVAPWVAAGLRVILWDYRGHGRSEAPHDPAAYAMAQVVDDLSRVLAWGAGDEPAVLKVIKGTKTPKSLKTEIEEILKRQASKK